MTPHEHCLLPIQQFLHRLGGGEAVSLDTPLLALRFYYQIFRNCNFYDTGAVAIWRIQVI